MTTMNTQDPTIANEHDPEQTLTELTLCLSQTYAARGRIHLDRGEFDLALGDLDDALHLDPDNIDTHRLRDLAHQRRVRDHQSETGQSDGLGHLNVVGNPLQVQFRAGYLVSARYHAEDPGTDQPLVLNPLTENGRREAIEYAKSMCGKESRTQRRELYDAHWTHGEDFDTVVTEFRSLVRQIHLEKALDEDGQPVID